ncbi:MAG TPA: glucose-6-phosphate dehydrogenase [Anaerolineaceae bacterium]|nr:glucose-6-phosphate dehydrogenase [Anaerolineaceae bacterium]
MTNSTSIVIFGASGDLSNRKLIPALFNLFRKKRLIEPFRVFGTAGRPWTDDDFRQVARQQLDQVTRIPIQESLWQDFARKITYQPGNVADSKTYQEIHASLTALENGPANRMYYLATPPEYFLEIIKGLAAANMLAEDGGWRRVVIEKPFGSDLASARSLNQNIHAVLNENQVYRIDHYLGKETVQNIMVARFANAIFEPLWNRNYIDNVQITVAETVGVGSRARYYDKAGIIRDMFQNHLLQLLTLVAMEPTSSYNADATRDEKIKVIRAIRPIRGEEVFRHSAIGQYRGYLQEPNVPPASRAPTYAMVRFFIDNWRWQGVPFYLRSGKKLEDKVSEIIIQFKKPPHMIFPTSDLEGSSNLLAMCLQPDEGIHLRFETKVPDTVSQTRSVNMAYHYSDVFDSNEIPEAYERLLLDVVTGDASLFTRADQTELSWALFDPILNAWEDASSPAPEIYEPGSWGPETANRLLQSEGRQWTQICGEHCGHRSSANVEETDAA